MKHCIILHFCAFFAAIALIPAISSAFHSRPAETLPPSRLPEILPEPGIFHSTAPALTLPKTYRILDAETGKILELSPLEYLCGVTAAEMPVSFHPEALKAQAVAAHSYALRQMGMQFQHPDPALKGAFLSTDPAHFQAYKSKEARKTLWGAQFDALEAKLTGAVREVFTQILIYEEEPAAAAFHAMSAGKTESARDIWGQEIPYLIPTDSPEDAENPAVATEIRLTVQETAAILSARVGNLALPENPAEWFQVQSRTAGGSVKTVQTGETLLTGEQLRGMLGLPSAHFTVQFDGENFCFTVRGRGHGVGMSQHGANAMAENGADWREILTRYYPGTRLTEAGT